jgi:hypothetical protein
MRKKALKRKRFHEKVLKSGRRKSLINSPSIIISGASIKVATDVKDFYFTNKI